MIKLISNLTYQDHIDIITLDLVDGLYDLIII